MDRKGSRRRPIVFSDRLCFLCQSLFFMTVTICYLLASCSVAGLVWGRQPMRSEDKRSEAIGT